MYFPGVNCAFSYFFMDLYGDRVCYSGQRGGNTAQMQNLQLDNKSDKQMQNNGTNTKPGNKNAKSQRTIRKATTQMQGTTTRTQKLQHDDKSYSVDTEIRKRQHGFRATTRRRKPGTQMHTFKTVKFKPLTLQNTYKSYQCRCNSHNKDAKSCNTDSSARYTTDTDVDNTD